MPNYMKLIVMGHLTNDPEIRETGNGIHVGNCAIAYNEKNKEPVFLDCVMFGQTSEFVHQYFKRGNLILLDGRLQTNRWKGKDGVERVKLQMLVEKVAGTGKENTGTGTSGDNQTSTPQEPYGAKPEPSDAGENKEIPF